MQSVAKLFTLFTLCAAAMAFAQEPLLPLPRSQETADSSAERLSTESSVATTTSMDKLDATRELLIGDVLSFRIIEDEEPKQPPKRRLWQVVAGVVLVLLIIAQVI